MPVNLNLLPDNVAPKGGLARTLTMTKQLTVILLAVFIIIVVGISGFFLVSSLELDRLTSEIDSLKTQIAQQETVETQVVLLKDRIDKIKTAQKIASAQGPMDQITPVISSIPQGSALADLSLDSTKTDLSVAFDSSASLGDFFKQLTTSTSFSSIVLTSFGLNPASGYLASLRFIDK